MLFFVAHFGFQTSRGWDPMTLTHELVRTDPARLSGLGPLDKSHGQIPQLVTFSHWQSFFF